MGNPNIPTGFSDDGVYTGGCFGGDMDDRDFYSLTEEDNDNT